MVKLGCCQVGKCRTRLPFRAESAPPMGVLVPRALVAECPLLSGSYLIRRLHNFTRLEFLLIRHGSSLFRYCNVQNFRVGHVGYELLASAGATDFYGAASATFAPLMPVDRTAACLAERATIQPRPGEPSPRDSHFLAHHFPLFTAAILASSSSCWRSAFFTECWPTRHPNGQRSSDPSCCLTTPDDWHVRQSGRSPCRMGRYSEARPLAYLPIA